MLVSLRIENFALIDQLEVNFGPGLNVLTGETGAGKSIILDAIDGVLGGKLSSRVIRTVNNPTNDTTPLRTLIEATFSLTPPLQAWLATAELDPLDETLVCSRELSLAGGSLRSRSRVNGVLVNRQQLQALRDLVVAITAQGQASQILQAGVQRDWLDSFGGAEVVTARQTVAAAYGAWQTLRQSQLDARQGEQQRLQQLDLYKFQLQELRLANLEDVDELEHLEEEFRRLNHLEQLRSQSLRAYQCLCEQERGPASVDLVGEAAGLLQEMQQYDASIAPIQELVEAALCQIETASRQLRNYTDGLDGDPQRLEDVTDRIAHLKQILRKYGPTLRDAITYQAKIETDFKALLATTTSQDELNAQLQAAETHLHQACAELHQLRLVTAQQLGQQLVQELHPLAMERVQFQAQLQPISATSHGADLINFLFSPNPGQPLQPLSETASGGEMSRFLLALRACFATIETVNTLIFDEIDVGVSGRVAQAIGEKLYHLAQQHQVLCVTHQPIIAALADTHFHVEKQVAETTQQTTVSIYPLNIDQRAEELAKLAGGDTNQPVLDFAAALLAQATEIRHSLKDKTNPSKTKTTRKKSAARS